MRTKQTGFTLVELAIAMVIIGLLLAGILKGQELINSGKVKNLAGDFRSIATAYWGYQDKFRAVAGDDKAADTHVGATAVTEVGNGNGAIGGAWDSSTTSDESVMFWSHVRRAGLLPGPTAIAGTSPYLPTNSVGGRIGITSGSVAADKPMSNADFAGAFYICSGSIPGKLAKEIDTALDDGVSNTGSVRVVLPAGGAAVPMTGQGAIDDNTLYTVCVAN